MTDPRLHIRGLSPASGTPGQIPTINDAGTALEFRASGSGGLTVQDENGNVATGVTQIDFQGAGVTASAGTGEVIVTVPGATSSGASAGLTQLAKSANQTLTSLSFATLTWQTETYDDLGAFNATTSTTRLVAPATGIYEIGCIVAFSGCNNGSGRGIHFKRNGTALSTGRSMVYLNGGFGDVQLIRILKLNAGDYVEAEAYGEGSPVAVASQFGDSGTLITMRQL